MSEVAIGPHRGRWRAKGGPGGGEQRCARQRAAANAAFSAKPPTVSPAGRHLPQGGRL